MRDVCAYPRRNKPIKLLFQSYVLPSRGAIPRGGLGKGLNAKITKLNKEKLRTNEGRIQLFTN